jgi:hypothetical protein
MDNCLAQKQSLRKPVSRMREDVWRERGGLDVYTQRPRVRIQEAEQNVDHVLEVQIVEHAVFLGARPITRELLDRFRGVVNASLNLNVTDKRVNQAKRGPFTAAINRLRKYDGGLREISAEQLARAGRAKWLVDTGVWANIERQTIISYEDLVQKLEETRLTRAQTGVLEAAMDNLHGTLEKINIL